MKAFAATFVEVWWIFSCYSSISAPSHNLYFAHRSLQKSNKSLSNPSCEDAANLAELLQLTRAALEQLQSEVRRLSSQVDGLDTDLSFMASWNKITRSGFDDPLSFDTIFFPHHLQCEFLNDEKQSPEVFSSSSLQVTACDLKQLMATFNHVYETELRAYCNREPPSFSSETDVFQRVHHLLLAFTTVGTSTEAPPAPVIELYQYLIQSIFLLHFLCQELEILKEVNDATAASTNDGAIPTQSHSQPQGQKHTFRT